MEMFEMIFVKKNFLKFSEIQNFVAAHILQRRTHAHVIHSLPSSYLVRFLKS